MMRKNYLAVIFIFCFFLTSQRALSQASPGTTCIRPLIVYKELVRYLNPDADLDKHPESQPVEKVGGPVINFPGSRAEAHT